MDKKKLQTIEEKVYDYLCKYEELRNDDMKLYACYVFDERPVVDGKNFFDVMFDHNMYHLPSYESVTRVRRKVQEKHPELRPPKKDYDAKMEKQKVYVDYAVSA